MWRGHSGRDDTGDCRWSRVPDRCDGDGLHPAVRRLRPDWRRIYLNLSVLMTLSAAVGVSEKRYRAAPRVFGDSPMILNPPVKARSLTSCARCCR